MYAPKIILFLKFLEIFNFGRTIYTHNTLGCQLPSARRIVELQILQIFYLPLPPCRLPFVRNNVVPLLSCCKAVPFAATVRLNMHAEVATKVPGTQSVESAIHAISTSSTDIDRPKGSLRMGRQKNSSMSRQWQICILQCTPQVPNMYGCTEVRSSSHL